MKHLVDLSQTAALDRAFAHLNDGFTRLPPAAPSPPQDLETVLQEVASRLRDNYPYFHPLYAGQMLKPPHPIARLAYHLAMAINPNNHALDGGRASSAMEKEAVAELAAMIGWEKHLGHLTSGGTMANLEALWIAGQLHPGKLIVASQQAHYTHARLCQVLQLPFAAIPADRAGRMDVEALSRLLQGGQVGTVVATIGTTAAGAVDPLPDLLDLRRQHGFRLHGDAAYGGYFVLAENLAPATRSSFDRLRELDSIVIDPHKHGLQPYGCGCILFPDPALGRFYQHDSPYTYFTSHELHLGEISLECSRPGAAAVALWATQRLLPLVRGGEFAHQLERSRAAAMDLYQRLQNDARFLTAFVPELDIVMWVVRAARATEVSALSERVFQEAAQRHLHLALASVPVHFFEGAGIEADAVTIRCLRSVLMKPEHLDWTETLWKILTDAAAAALV